MKTQLDIFSGFYESDSKPISSQNCINWIPAITEGGALAVNSLLTPQSLSTFGSAGAGSNRGSIKMAKVPYFVNGNTLYSQDSSGVSTALGVITGSGRVSMATNGVKLCIVVPGSTAYVYNGTTTEPITDPDFRLSDIVVYKDGYFVFSASDGSVFFNSELNDPSNIDPLDFGTAEINPDLIVSEHVSHNELFVLGEESIEVFQNVGGSGFPFRRIPGANIQKGCYAKFSPLDFDNTFLFIGGGKNEKAAIWRVVSSQSAQKLSTDAIDNAIQKFTRDEIADAFSFTYTVSGQFIAAFTINSTAIESKTFCYNATSKKWFQMRSGLTGSWRVNSIVYAYDKLLCGDAVDGRIGYLSDVYSEYDLIIYRERTSQPFIVDGNSQYWPEIKLTIESGVGLTTGQGDNPRIRMSFSDNGARTFTPEKSRSFGRKGEYNIIPTWRRNGRVPSHRIVRITETDPVRCNLIRTDAVIEQGYG